MLEQQALSYTELLPCLRCRVEEHLSLCGVLRGHQTACMGWRQNRELRLVPQNVTAAGVKCWYKEETHRGVTAAPHVRGNNVWALRAAHLWTGEMKLKAVLSSRGQEMKCD